MSFHDKEFWMPKGGGHLSNGEAAFDSSSRIEAKRARQCLSGAAELELSLNKKQAIHTSVSKSTSRIAMTSSSSWGTSSGLKSGANQFIDGLFGADNTRQGDLTKRSTSPGNTENSTFREKVIDDQAGDDPLVGISMSYTIEEPQACVSYSGIGKAKVNPVEDPENAFRSPTVNSVNISISQVCGSASETSFLSMGQAYGKESESEPYNPGPTSARSIGSNVEKGHSTAAIADSYNRGDSDTIFGYDLMCDIDALSRPISSYDYLHYQSSVQTSKTHGDNQLDSSNANAVDISSQTSKSRPDSMPKNKSESKSSCKKAPNSFPSNVRSLLATGMFDGVPVKYVSSRQELCGVIKGSGYLCGCQPCNYAKASYSLYFFICNCSFFSLCQKFAIVYLYVHLKVLNAYEFERHAGCKTKHPNDHICFVNGKTIYQISQELRCTPESLLFDAIQTVTGSPINQKAFRIWKESFQAATRELQRIYGKEELNL